MARLVVPAMWVCELERLELIADGGAPDVRREIAGGIKIALGGVEDSDASGRRDRAEIHVQVLAPDRPVAVERPLEAGTDGPTRPQLRVARGAGALKNGLPELVQ